MTVCQYRFSNVRFRDGDQLGIGKIQRELYTSFVERLDHERKDRFCMFEWIICTSEPPPIHSIETVIGRKRRLKAPYLSILILTSIDSCSSREAIESQTFALVFLVAMGDLQIGFILLLILGETSGKYSADQHYLDRMQDEADQSGKTWFLNTDTVEEEGVQDTIPTEDWFIDENRIKWFFLSYCWFPMNFRRCNHSWRYHRYRKFQWIATFVAI